MQRKDWNQFCDQLKAAGDLIEKNSASEDPLTRAEGYRYLTRLLRAGLESCVEGADPRFPVFYSLSHDTVKIGNDNPDNYYLNCAVSGAYEYMLEGEPGEVSYFSLATKAGSYATTGDMQPTGELDSHAVAREADGSFRVLLSCSPPADESVNWLPMRPESDNLLIRQYCNARRERAAQFKIRCLNAAAAPEAAPPELAQQLANAVGFVHGTGTLFSDWMAMFKQHTNELPANDQDMCLKIGGNANIHYHNSHWQLAAGEALVIEPERIPECESWNIQLSNYWMESLDYRYYPTTYNAESAQPDEHGHYLFVVAHADPGPKYPNWLSTAGHSEGAMLFRWIGAREYPAINTRTVLLEDL